MTFFIFKQLFKEIFMKYITILFSIILFSCNSGNRTAHDLIEKENEINLFIDNWHKAAAETNDSVFFGSMAENSIYIGTDESELWTKQEFYDFAIKYFNQGKAWDFKPIERNIYFNEDYSIAWFDEKLDTWMGICRASGVLEFRNNKWEIVHYHLSMTVPNEKVREVISIIDMDSTINK